MATGQLNPLPVFTEDDNYMSRKDIKVWKMFTDLDDKK